MLQSDTEASKNKQLHVYRPLHTIIRRITPMPPHKYNLAFLLKNLQKPPLSTTTSEILRTPMLGAAIPVRQWAGF